MDWEIAAPYVAAGVALIVGAASALLAARNARRTLQEQRALSRDERLWDKQAEVYVDLLEWCQTAAAAARASRTKNGDPVSEHERINAVRIAPKLVARVAAFGSTAVRDELVKVRTAAKDFIDSTAKKSEPERLKGQFRSNTRLWKALERIEELIRCELQVKGGRSQDEPAGSAEEGKRAS
jgi:hypothetical protein